MVWRPPLTLLQRCLNTGFDQSVEKDGQVKVKCSQCKVRIINGVPCHEQACWNFKKAVKDGFLEVKVIVVDL